MAAFEDTATDLLEFGDVDVTDADQRASEAAQELLRRIAQITKLDIVIATAQALSVYLTVDIWPQEWRELMQHLTLPISLEFSLGSVTPEAELIFKLLVPAALLLIYSPVGLWWRVEALADDLFVNTRAELRWAAGRLLFWAAFLGGWLALATWSWATLFAAFAAAAGLWAAYAAAVYGIKYLAYPGSQDAAAEQAFVLRLRHAVRTLALFGQTVAYVPVTVAIVETLIDPPSDYGLAIACAAGVPYVVGYPLLLLRWLRREVVRPQKLFDGVVFRAKPGRTTCSMAGNYLALLQQLVAGPVLMALYCGLSAWLAPKAFDLSSVLSVTMVVPAYDYGATLCTMKEQRDLVDQFEAQPSVGRPLAALMLPFDDHGVVRYWKVFQLLEKLLVVVAITIPADALGWEEARLPFAPLALAVFMLLVSLVVAPYRDSEQERKEGRRAAADRVDLIQRLVTVCNLGASTALALGHGHDEGAVSIALFAINCVNACYLVYELDVWGKLALLGKLPAAYKRVKEGRIERQKAENKRLYDSVEQFVLSDFDDEKELLLKEIVAELRSGFADPLWIPPNARLGDTTAYECLLSAYQLDWNEAAGLAWKNMGLSSRKLPTELLSPHGRELRGLSTLRHMCVRNCRALTALPVQIGNMTSLRFLSLNGCRLTTLPSEIGLLTNLTQLVLRENSALTTLPPELGDLALLSMLYLDNCPRLRALPDSMAKLTALDRLSLPMHLLPNVSELGLAGSISTLHVTGSDSQLADALLDFCSVTDLTVQCPNISALPEPLGTALRLLTIERARLTTLPDSLSQCSSLQRLFVADCPLAALPDLGGLQALTQLHILRAPQLTALPAELGQLCNLQELDFSGSGLRELPGDVIGQLEGLEELWLRDCAHLTQLPPELGQLLSLQVLSLRGCAHLELLPREIGQLTRLRRLLLTGCSRLRYLPSPDIGGLVSLQKLDLDGCSRIKSLPAELGQLGQLARLDADSCRNLRAVPKELANLTRCVFNFNHNLRLWSFPPELDEARQQGRLYASVI